MKRIYKNILFFIFLSGTFYFSNLRSQNRAADSIQKLINVAPTDSERVQLMLDLSGAIKDSVVRVRKMYDALNYAVKTNCKWGITMIEAKFGYYYMFTAIDYPLATYWTTRSLKNCLANGNLRGEAQCYQQLGLISHTFEDEVSAIDYFKKAAAINEKLNNGKSLRTNYSMIGLVSMTLNHLDSALLFYRKAHTLTIQNKMSPAVLYVNMTECFLKLNLLDSAKLYIHLTDSAYKKQKNSYGIHWVDLLNGKLALRKGNTAEALIFLKKPYEHAKKISKAELLSEVLPSLIEAYKQSRKFEEAFFGLNELNVLNDSLNGAKKASKVLAIRQKFEEEQAAEILRLKHEKIETAHQVEINDRNKVILGTAAMLLIVSVFGFFVLRGYRQKQRANKIITEQKLLVEEKQKEILDSIHYAKRIQTALITSEKYISRHLDKLSGKKTGF